MTPSFPDTALIYSVAGGSWGDETASLEFTVACIVEQTNVHTSADNIESGEGTAIMFCLKQATDFDGKLVSHDNNWYRVVSEFEPKRSVFTASVNHVEVTLQRVVAPEVVV